MIFASTLGIAAILATAANEQATAGVRIFKAVRITQASWGEVPPNMKLEKIVREADGQLTLLRTVEFQ